MLRSTVDFTAFGWRAAASTWLLTSILSSPMEAASSASAAPASVPVQTSRGEFQLLVSAPAPPDAGDPADHAGASGGPDKPLVLLTSGEGGWRHIDSLVLLAPGPWATFEVSPLDWIRTGTTPSDHPVSSAIERLSAAAGSGGLRVLCIDAADHSPSGCPASRTPGIQRLTLPGGHHFSGDYETLARRILEFLES